MAQMRRVYFEELSVCKQIYMKTRKYRSSVLPLLGLNYQIFSEKGISYVICMLKDYQDVLGWFYFPGLFPYYPVS